MPAIKRTLQLLSSNWDLSHRYITSNNFHIIRRWSMKEFTVLLLKVNTMLFALGRRARCTTTIFIIIWKWWWRRWRRYIIDSVYTEAGYILCMYIIHCGGFTMAARGLVCIIPAGLPGIGGLNFGNIMNNPAFMNMVYSYRPLCCDSCF